jgi:DNA repair photolyase
MSPKKVRKFTINTHRVNSILEPNTSSIDSRIEAARRLQDIGYTVLFRIDPMLWYEGAENDYQNLVKQILSDVRPNHITLGTPRFQSMSEIAKCRANLSSEQRRLFDQTSRLIEETKPGIPVAGNHHSKTAYFKNMAFSLPDTVRSALYRTVITSLNYYNFTNIGICEEPLAIWNSLNLKRVGAKERDCSCNYIPLNKEEINE